MLNQKKVEIFLAKFHKSLAKQFLEIAYSVYPLWVHTQRIRIPGTTDIICIISVDGGIVVATGGCKS